MEKFEDDETFAKFINYMKKALHNRRLNYIRDNRKIKEYEISFDDLKQEVILNNQKQFILETTAVLNEKEIEVLKLYYEDGLTYKEIAVLMKIQPESARKIKYRAIKKLRGDKK